MSAYHHVRSVSRNDDKSLATKMTLLRQFVVAHELYFTTLLHFGRHFAKLLQRVILYRKRASSAGHRQPRVNTAYRNYRHEYGASKSRLYR